MTLAEKYGIQKNSVVGSIELTKNPYSFKGTFEELYNLTASGRLKLLKQDGRLVGGSISGYDTVEDDNLAGKAFMEAYMCKPLMDYVNLATQLVEANLIPTIISEDPLKVSILNGLVVLDQYGNEIHNDGDEAPAEDQDEDEDEYLVPGDVVDDTRNIKNYIRYTEGRCLARGCNPNIEYDADRDVYVVTGLEFGRKLTDAELDLIDVEYED